MSRKSLLAKSQKKQKFSVRQHNRCPLCGRARGFMRHFGVCRICFRNMSRAGELPGVRKSSW